MEVHFRPFMAYEIRLPILNHLQKSTSDLWFMFFTSHIYAPIKQMFILINAAKMAATIQKI